MSKVTDTITNKAVKYSLFPWFTFFIIIKLYGTSLAAWSWWWLLWPSWPVLSLAVKALHL